MRDSKHNTSIGSHVTLHTLTKSEQELLELRKKKWENKEAYITLKIELASEES